MDLTLAWISLVCAGVPALLFLWNLCLYRRTPEASAATLAVSVLIPARNEELTIGAAVTSALGNRGVECEVLVLDDGSSDRTAEEVEAIGSRDPRVRLLRGGALPSGWCGKQYACYVLAQQARYPLLFFMDADVVLAENALARVATFLKSRGVALASGFPRQQTGTALERLLIPLIHFLLLGFLPVYRMRRTTRPAYAAGCGQLFIADAAAYRAAGGHSAIRATLHDGINLPRAFRRAGFRTDLFDATDIACCRMYRSAREVWNGLLKNATEGLAAPTMIVPATLLLAAGQIAPLVLVASTEGPARAIAAAALAASYISRLVSVPLFRQSLASALLHPAGILLLLVIQWQAFLRHLVGRQPQWKGRTYRPVPSEPRS